MTTDLPPLPQKAAGSGGGDEQRGLLSLVGDSAAYGIGIALLPGALLLATPVLARELGPAGFGTVEVLASIVAFLVLVALLGMDSAVGRTYFDFPHDGDRRRATVRFGLVVTTAVSLGLAAILALGGVVGLVGEMSVTTSVATVAASALIPLGTAVAIARLSFVLTRQRTAYLTVGATQAAVGVGVAVLLVLADLGPPGYFVGLATGAVAALCASLALGDLLRRPTRPLDRAEMRLMLAYGLPLVPAAAATWAVFAVDRTLVATIRDLDEAGYYGIGSKVTAPMMLAISAFAIAWAPFIFSHRARHAELRARALILVVAGAALLFLPLVLFAPELVRLLGGDEFRSATRAVPGLAIGWLGFAAATVLSTGFSLERRTKVIAVATVTAAAINIGLNLVLIAPFGFVAAAWVTATSFVLLAGIYWLWERRSAPVGYRLGRLATICSVTGAATVVALLTSGGEAPFARVAGCVIGAAVVLLAAAGPDRARLARQDPGEASPG